MLFTPRSDARQRPARQKLTEPTPAVLRFATGNRVRAKLQVISITGGLLFLHNLIDRGSQARLLFLTETGAVLGTAEMLIPITSTLQPFRFVAIGDDEQGRISNSVKLGAERRLRDRQSIYYERAW